MLILLDIGNTAATFGIYGGGRLHQFGTCLYNDIPKLIKKNSTCGGNESLNVVISSVVPKITDKIRLSNHSKKILFWEAGKNLPVPVRHRYPKGSAPGIDRIVNVYGALRIYKAPALVIDFGTAVTFDYISKAGIFEGGMIIPGPELSFQALIQRAARLPKKARLPLKAASFIGHNTEECLSSGILEGYGAMTDGLIDRFKSKYGKDLRVIATGGFAGHLKPYAKHLEVIDPQHSIKSLLLLFKQHNI